MNKIYKTFYKQRVFTLDEVNKLTKSRQVAKNAIQRLMKESYVKRIKPGLYHIIPLDNEGYIPDSIKIASKLTKKFFFSHMTALQIHDLAESKKLYMSCDKSQSFKLYGNEYRLIKTKFFGTEEKIVGNQKVNVSDIERTFLDCLDNISIFPNIEEFIQIMSNANINSGKVLDHLKKFRKKKLYHFAGYFLERMQEFLNPNPKDLAKIKKKLSTKVYYIQVNPKGRYSRLKERLIGGTPTYNKDWNVVVVE